MKKLIITTIVVCLSVLTGCDDRDARDYAKELVGVLNTYQSEVNKKIGAERKSYKHLAGTYAYARQVDLMTGLSTERLSRADRLTDALIAGEKLSPSDVHKLVLEHADLEFNSTRKALEQEVDEQAEYLASLESLELQSQNIAQLAKALDALSKPRSNVTKLKELAKAAKDVKTKFDELQCDELAQEIACLKAQQATIEARTDLSQDQKKTKKQKIENQIKPLLELSNEQNCNQTKLKDAKCPDKKG